MENYSITKEQILEVSQWGSPKDLIKLKEWFPDAFKLKLEVGKWYKVSNLKDGSLGFDGIGIYTLDCSNHGLMNLDIGYNFLDVNGIIWRTDGDISLASDKEVETALIEEAKKIGYTTENTKCLLGLNRQKVTGNFHYESISNRLYSASNLKGGKVLFDGGKWAEIIKTITKEEAEKLLNKKII